VEAEDCPLPDTICLLELIQPGSNFSATLPVQNLYEMKRQPAPAKAKLIILHRPGGFRKITVFQNPEPEVS